MVFSEELVDKICKFIENGATQKDAAIMVGINESTLYEWKKTNPSFTSRLKLSNLNFKQKLIDIVMTMSLKDGKLALEMLRTRFPEEWNRVLKVGLVDPERELERIRKLIYGEPDTAPDMGEDSLQKQGGTTLPDDPRST